MKSTIEYVSFGSRVQEHSNDHTNDFFKTLIEFSTPSNVRLFRSLHIAQIMHKRAIFQTKKPSIFTKPNSLIKEDIHKFRAT